MTDTDRHLLLDVIRVKLANCSDTTVNLVWQLVHRDEAGRAKYGTTMDRTDLLTEAWLQHMTEEALDFAAYAQAAIRTMRTQK